MTRSSTISSNPIHTPQGAVSAEEFAERLCEDVERDLVTFKSSHARKQFLLVATATIYAAMIETCGQGIKQ